MSARLGECGLYPAVQDGIHGPRPGPIVARVAPKIANPTGIRTVAGADKAIQSSMPAMRPPAAGGHIKVRRVLLEAVMSLSMRMKEESGNLAYWRRTR